MLPPFIACENHSLSSSGRKVIGYPVVPAIFVAAAIYLVVNALISDPKWTSITFAVVLAGLPVYYAIFQHSRPV